MRLDVSYEYTVGKREGGRECAACKLSIRLQTSLSAALSTANLHEISEILSGKLRRGERLHSSCMCACCVLEASWLELVNQDP